MSDTAGLLQIDALFARNLAALPQVGRLNLVAPRFARGIRSDGQCVELPKVGRIRLHVDRRAEPDVDIVGRGARALRADRPPHLATEALLLELATGDRILGLRLGDGGVVVGELAL